MLDKDTPEKDTIDNGAVSDDLEGFHQSEEKNVIPAMFKATLAEIEERRKHPPEPEPLQLFKLQLQELAHNRYVHRRIFLISATVLSLYFALMMVELSLAHLRAIISA